ncbi:hypothetical protein K6T82_23935 [Flavobacterium sp. 17A]|uniref:Uncharacterized protein n=1 Tax=Flavobacterium potami TaxID=2872310 RepID=A0A9X1HEG7_9FLAO|nr:hypothetical protein [Flavobacterium potami]MBZ4037829.1 hypothetical protein [Flavobacterium potami]
MEKQVVIFEVLKFFAVLLFLGCFFIAAKKAKVIINGMYEILNENKIELEDKYRKKLSARVVKNQISFKPFEKEKLRKFLNNEIFDSKEFKLNIKQKVIV